MSKKQTNTAVSLTLYAGYGKIQPLAEVLAQIAQFSISDYDPIPVPDEVQRNCAYVCACFLAQHTKDGVEGVETDVAMDLLKIGQSMSYGNRVLHAKRAIEEFGGIK